MQRIGDSKAADTTVRDERIKAHWGLVKSIAGDIRSQPLGRGVELDDLVGYGAKGLLEAAARFDGRGVHFVAFARRRIYGAIVDGIRTQHWFGRRADRRLRVDRVGQDWQIALGGADQVHNDVRWNGRPMVCPPIETEDISAKVAAALRGLPVLERQLVDLCYYQEKTLTQAAKELGIGRPWASRLHARALAALRTAVRADSFLSLPPSSRNIRLAPDRPSGVSRGFRARDRHDLMIAEGVAR